jgi:5-methylcytosine-specific restriction endonuclease McrA
LITDGTDVRSISHLGRTIPARLRTAVEEAYPTCAVEGCEVDRHLEIDHKLDVALGGPTELANLQRLCPHHHDEKTRSRGYLAGPDPPPDRPPKRARE